jgi:hypothetical protein
MLSRIKDAGNWALDAVWDFVGIVIQGFFDFIDYIEGY